jgi:thiamine-phosphate pyrophosphorylase
MPKKFHLLTLVTHKGSAPEKPYLEFIQTCVKAGVTCVQLREKNLSSEALLHFGRSLKNLLDAYSVPLIINDDVDLCVKLDAAGVHLGQSDAPIQKARAILGDRKIIGLSVNTLEQVQASSQQPIDYIGVGAIFPTHHKPNVETFWGLDGLKKVKTIAKNPIIAIGGIDHHNALSVMNAGASGIAAIGAFHHAKDPSLEAEDLMKIINKTHHD